MQKGYLLGVDIGTYSSNGALVTPDGKVTLEAVYCLGLCPMGPAALIDGKPKAAIKAKSVDALIKELA